MAHLLRPVDFDCHRLPCRILRSLSEQKKMIIKYDFKKRTPRLVLGSEHLDPVIGEITEEELPKNSQGFLPSVNFKFGELGD